MGFASVRHLSSKEVGFLLALNENGNESEVNPSVEYFLSARIANLSAKWNFSYAVLESLYPSSISPEGEHRKCELQIKGRRLVGWNGLLAKKESRRPSVRSHFRFDLHC